MTITNSVDQLPPLPFAEDAFPEYLDNVAPAYKTPDKLDEYTRHGFIKGFPDSYRICDRHFGANGQPFRSQSLFHRAPPSAVMTGRWHRVFARRISDVFRPGPYLCSVVPAGLARVRIEIAGDPQRRSQVYHFRLTDVFADRDMLVPLCDRELLFRLCPHQGAATLSRDGSGGYLFVVPLADGLSWLAANTDLADPMVTIDGVLHEHDA